MPKIDMVKVATVGGVVLSLAGTIVAGWANAQKMNDVIVKEVQKSIPDRMFRKVKMILCLQQQQVL